MENLCRSSGYNDTWCIWPESVLISVCTCPHVMLYWLVIYYFIWCVDRTYILVESCSRSEMLRWRLDRNMQTLDELNVHESSRIHIWRYYCPCFYTKSVHSFLFIHQNLAHLCIISDEYRVVGEYLVRTVGTADVFGSECCLVALITSSHLIYDLSIFSNNDLSVGVHQSELTNYMHESEWFDV